MDIIGNQPKTANGYEYIIVATDYFTKWAEAIPWSNIRDRELIASVWQHIVCRLEVPKEIIVDNGVQFSSKKFGAFC